MDLRKPPPVRRLTPGAKVGPPPGPATPPGFGTSAPVNGSSNGHAAPSSFVTARRAERVALPTVERMQVEELSIAYGSKLAVKSVSLPIRQGEVLALIGPSGCGKTTLLRSLNRLTELTKSAALSGRITLDGVDIAGMEPTALRRRVTMVFQQPNPFPMSVFDNIAYVLREQARRKPRRQVLAPQVHSALQRAGVFGEVKDNLDSPA